MFWIVFWVVAAFATVIPMAGALASQSPAVRRWHKRHLVRLRQAMRRDVRRLSEFEGGQG